MPDPHYSDGLLVRPGLRVFASNLTLWAIDAFCYGKHVRQFHEIRTRTGPQEDPNTHAYILGVYPAAPQRGGEPPLQIQPNAVQVVHANTQVSLGSSGLSDILSAESEIDLAQDDDNGKRYLVQHWSSGTVCDMTGLERKVEVQVCVVHLLQ